MGRVTKMLVAGGLGLAMMAQAGPAEAVRIREYRGRTSAGKGMYLKISGRASELRLHKYAFRFNMDCEDGSTQRAAFFSSFGGPGLALHADRSFEDGEDLEEFAWMTTGTVGPHEAEGTFEFSIAFPDEPTCSTGALTWSAHERDIVERTPGRQPDHLLRIRVTASGATRLHLRAASP